MTNREAFRGGLVPCEATPYDRSWATLDQEFHGEAVKTVGAHPQGWLRVCESCRMNAHREKVSRRGAVFA